MAAVAMKPHSRKIRHLIGCTNTLFLI